MLLVTATPNGAETGSAVNVARGALIYLYSPPRQLAAVSLGLVYSVRAGKKPDVGGDGSLQARRYRPGIAAENGRSSGGRCCRGGGGVRRAGPAIERYGDRRDRDRRPPDQMRTHTGVLLGRAAAAGDNLPGQRAAPASQTGARCGVVLPWLDDRWGRWTTAGEGGRP
jgi:hypothetical protein